MRFDRNQLDLLAKYFSDLSKILVASTVVGFFIPSGGEVSMLVFIVGLALAIGSLVFGVKLAKMNTRWVNNS